MERLATKRVYEGSTDEDGLRILVDRMWPRGISKDDERVDEWLGEVVPTEDLRKWFHEHKDFANFTKKYCKELSGIFALGKLSESCVAWRRTPGG